MDIYSELRKVRSNTSNVIQCLYSGPYIGNAGLYKITIPINKNTSIMQFEIDGGDSSAYTGNITIESPSYGVLYEGSASELSPSDFSPICSTYINDSMNTAIEYFNRTEDLFIYIEISEESASDESLSVTAFFIDLSYVSNVEKLR